MLTNELFNTDYERRISEGAVDRLEQRRIDDLNMKMDDLANRVKSTANPEHKKSLLKAFLDCKAERDSYYKIKEGEVTKTSTGIRHHAKPGVYGGFEKEKDPLAKLDKGTTNSLEKGMGIKFDREKKYQGGLDLDEAGIGQDIVDKSEKMARATPSTPAGKVASTVKNAAKWLAGQGGPGKEGPTYESDNSDEDNYEQVLDAIAALYGPEIWNNDAMGDLANDLEQVNPTPQELDFIIKHGKLPKRLQGMQFTNNDTVQFGEGANDIEDRGEYDQEGDMAKDNIHTIVRNARELESILGNNDNLPEWVQDKLANIKGMMTAVSEYMQTQQERDHEEGITISEKLKGLPTKKLGTARDAGKSVRKFRKQSGLAEAGTDSQWSKESDWKAIPKAKSGKPVDPRGEVTHLSDVARRKAEREAGQKKNSKEVAEHGGGIGPKQHWQDLMPEGFQDFNKVEPYAVCLAGKPVKKFDYYEDARRFHDNWKAKLYREGNEAKAEKITLLPLGLDEAMNVNDLLNKVTKDSNKDFKKAKAGKLKSSGNFTKGDHWTGAGPDDYGYTGYQGHGMPTDRAEQARIRADKKKGVAEGMFGTLGEDQDTSAVESAIIRRLMVAHTDLLMKFGPEKVMQAAEEVAYNVGDVDEIGTSDVSAYVAQVKQILGVPEELDEKWSQKYKSSINCATPKGFSQRAHCAGKKK